ncbi:MAG TPA: sulfatase, partial [Thermoanaerobaculia bacterium]
IRSSVLDRITIPIGIALIAAPVLVLTIAWAVRASRRRVGLALAVLAVWCAVGWSFHRKWPEDKQLTHLWLSPHVELLRTTALRLSGGRRPGFPKEFPPEYQDEFRTFAARKPATHSHFPLPEGAARPKNVVVVVLESVGTKYLSLYGHPRDLTPTLTTEARHALVFDNIYAHASFSFASFRPINYSVYPGLPWHYALLGDARPIPKTLAAAMQARGARTGYFMAGDLDWGDQRWLLERQPGFETVQGAADLACERLSSWGAEDRCLFDRLLGWMAEKPEQPFFAVVWTDQTHDPYLLSPGATATDMAPGDTPPAFAADLTRYLSLLRNVDAQLARLFAALRERGIADDTLVVVTGDHGEAFGDPHGQRGHAWSVYEEEVHVPLMLWNPRLFPEGRRVSTIGGHVDLNPTIADILGAVPDSEWQGYSLFDPARQERAYFMAIAGGDIFGVREGDWKYIYDVTSARESLFNLRLDPDEQHDFAKGEPERAAQLRQRVAAWVEFEDAFLWGREN